MGEGEGDTEYGSLGRWDGLSCSTSEGPGPQGACAASGNLHCYH
jgi:hypothetical protein